MEEMIEDPSSASDGHASSIPARPSAPTSRLRPVRLEALLFSPLRDGKAWIVVTNASNGHALGRPTAANTSSCAAARGLSVERGVWSDGWRQGLPAVSGSLCVQFWDNRRLRSGLANRTPGRLPLVNSTPALPLGAALCTATIWIIAQCLSCDMLGKWPYR